MKYRVKLDLSFDKESDAQALMNYAIGISIKAVSINEGLANEEISFIEKHLCGHDSGKACVNHEREEVIDKKVVTVLSVL